MEHDFPRAIYQRACSRIRPSAQPEREAIMNERPRKIPCFKRKTFVVFASVLTMLFSMSVAAVAATGGEIVKDVVRQIFRWADLSVSEEESAPGKTVCYTEEGQKITIVHQQNKTGEECAELIYHADQGWLGLKIGEEEKDITEELLSKGVYTEEYSAAGKRFRATVTGRPESAILETEAIDAE